MGRKVPEVISLTRSAATTTQRRRQQYLRSNGESVDNFICKLSNGVHAYLHESLKYKLQRYQRFGNSRL